MTENAGSPGVVSSLDEDEFPLSSSLSVLSDSSDSAISEPSAVAVPVPETASAFAFAVAGFVAVPFKLSGLSGSVVVWWW